MQRGAPGRSREPGGRPPQTITRQSAPSACASSMARRLSSMAAAAGRVAAVNMPPRQRPETRSPASRMCRAGVRRRPSLAATVAPGRDRRDAVPRAALDALRERPLVPHRHGVERAGARAPPSMPRRASASSARMRAQPPAPGRAAARPRRPAGTARRDAGCERALCWPPTMVKWSWWPFSQAMNTTPVL